MSQDNKKSFVMYQGDGSNNVFSVPMTKGKYGTISVAFVRRGLDQYEYNPDTWGLNGGLFAWNLSGVKVYTDTATPAIGATIYDQYGVDTGDTVTAVGGATITVNTNVYTRDTLHDVDENTVLTWTGDTLQIGDYIVIERTTTRTQPFEFQNNQKHIEKSDDNLERQIQEVADKVDNALLVDPTHTIDSNKMTPVEWMQTILRSVDKSVRGFRFLNGWLDYSLDDPNIADVDKTWTHLVNTDNIKAIREQSRIENNETIYYTEYLAQDGSWKTLSDPHKWDNMKLSDLADTDFTNLSVGNFIMFDGLKWKNVYSSATASWGTLVGDITTQSDLMAEFAKKLDLSGGTMTGDLAFQSDVSYPVLHIHQSATTPNRLILFKEGVANKTISFDLSQSAIRLEKLYTSKINNGYDIAVPVTNSADTFALKSQVDLAANSGSQLYPTGVWYAKMYSASTVPTDAEYDGRNYADFSQVDNDNNPIIVIYEGQSGAWVEIDRITPPSEYNGYVTITSKIWDIAEQTDQQGGEVLWSYNQKTFTPYPKIVSLFNQANTDLSNLTSVGQNIGNWSSNVANCITNIPQDIKLELNNGTLKLKAGSKVYIPNGPNVFDITTTQSDKVLSGGLATGREFVYLTIGGLLLHYADNSSGSDWNATSQYQCRYNTSANMIKNTNNTGSTWETQVSFPLAIITLNNGVVQSIDQVFNGFGYIGSTVFALPGVKGLIPDGRNADGSLKNIEFTVNNVAIRSTDQRGNDTGLFDIAGGILCWDTGVLFTDYYPTPATGNWWMVYDTKKNAYFQSDDGGAYYETRRTTFGDWRKREGENKIISFTPRTVFRAVDYDDVANRIAALLQAIYPVGSVYIGTQSTCPMATLISNSTWELVSSGRALWTGDGNNANTTIEAGLPNITGDINVISHNVLANGAFSNTSSFNSHGWDGTATGGRTYNFNASRSSSIYGNSSTVQPPAYVVNVWRRTA